MGRRDAESETLIATGGYFKAFDPQSGGDLRGLELKDTAQLQRSQVPGVVCATGERTHALTTTAAKHTTEDGTGRGTPITPSVSGTLSSRSTAGGGLGTDFDLAGGLQVAKKNRLAVRRLVPEECEALQGFPRNYTRISYKKRPTEYCPDGPRYKALGNSMAVPVMRWIGQRLQVVEEA